MWIFPAETDPVFVVRYNPTRGTLSGWLDDPARNHAHQRALEDWHADFPDRPHVLLRSRSRKALEWCLESRTRVHKAPLSNFNEWSIFDAHHAADYRFRLLLPHHAWCRVFIRLMDTIGYDSLKAETARLGARDRYRMLEDVHGVVASHQGRQ